LVRGISSHLWTKTPYLVFFGILYLHLWLWVDPSLLYYGSQAADQFPFCPLTWSYLVSHLPFAGGLTEYCAAFLSQLYHDAWAGALTLTGVAALLGWVVSASVRAVAGTRVPLVWAVPSLFVVVLANRYTHALLGLLNILAGLAAVRVYARAARGGWPVRVVLFLVISMLAYSIAPLGYAVYAVLCGCSELRKRRGWWLAAGYLVAAASVPYVLGVGVVGWDVGSPRARLLPPEMSIYSVGKASVGWLVWFLFGVGACAGLYGWRSRAAG
jgi:hypothetical protein